jgi:hypothetical protein
MAKNIYKKFKDPTLDFEKEPRAFFYDLASGFIKTAKDSDSENWYTSVSTIKGIMILLFAWNFAARETKKLNFNNIGRLLGKIKDDLKKLETVSIENVNEDQLEIVKKVFGHSKKLFGQTGASKALSLLNPQLFVMWDTKIRTTLRKMIVGIDNGEKPDNYIKYLSGIKNIICENNIKAKLAPDAIVAKKIDEYNYAHIVMRKRKA